MSEPVTHLLPDELVEKIISNLPSKPLIRFKSVSKTWCSLISSPQFLAKHLLPASHGDGTLLLVKRRHKTNTRDHVFSLLSHHKLTPTRLLPYPEPDPDPEELSPQIHISGPWVLPYPDLPPTDTSWPDHISVLGSCNSLVCLFDSRLRHIVLWSSVDGALKILPDSDVPDPPGYSSAMPVLGFGYDEDKEDYKVIKISDLEEVEDGRRVGGLHKVEIYSSKADRWKGNSIVEIAVSIQNYLHDPVAYVNGVIMWRGLKTGFRGCILWFRASDESFGEILFPMDGEIGGGTVWREKQLFVMNREKVALVVFDPSELGMCFHVWVLLEFGVEGSWTRLFTLGPLVGIERVLGFWDNGTMIMETGGGEVVLYDPFTGEMTSLNIRGAVGTLQITTIEERYVV